MKEIRSIIPSALDDSNYNQLLRLRGTDDSGVLDWINRK